MMTPPDPDLPEDRTPTERIPLGHGVHIRFSKDGRALYGGCKEDEIVPIVETYLRGSKGEERNLLEKWLEQKATQVERASKEDE